MKEHGQPPQFAAGETEYNRAQFTCFMPGYEQQIYSVDDSRRSEGHFEVLHENGSGTAFYDTAQYAAPKGDYKVYEDSGGGQWYAVPGEASVERKPVYAKGKPVYADDGSVKTYNSESVKYNTRPMRYSEPRQRSNNEFKAPRRKN